jgi:hypothetical protein
MPFPARCPHCQKHFTAPDAAEGKKLPCPQCRNAFTVSRESDPVRAAPAVAAPQQASVWEYLVEDLIELDESMVDARATKVDRKRAMAVPIQQRLDVLGTEGWELAASRYFEPASEGMTDVIGYWKMIFKRRKQ